MMLPPRSPRIVVVGSINVDRVIRLPTLPRPGETVIGGRFTSVCGGKGANQAVAAARAGGSTTFVAKVGADTAGDAAIAALRVAGIDTTHVGRDPEIATGEAFILVDDRGENMIVVAGGANERLLPADVDRVRGAIAAADVLLVQLEIPLATVRHAVGLARSAGVPVLLDPAPARPLAPQLLAAVSVLTPNETEAAVLTGRAVVDVDSAAVAAADLARRGPAVVVTLGGRGAIVAAGGAPILEPAFPVTPIDTVAAGDVFAGCLAVALAEGRGLTAAVRFAAAGAAISVTRPGAQDAAPARHEIEALAVLRTGGPDG